MQKILVITGMPGSGKTSYLKEHMSEFGDALICDDYYKSGPGRTVEFRGSVYYTDLREALKTGRNVVIADIVFCEDEFRSEMQDGIKALIEELEVEAEVEYRFFANDPEACIENILQRNRQDRVKSELKFIATHKDNYHIPSDTVLLPVFRNK
jgi:tRNA splicing ligase